MKSSEMPQLFSRELTKMLAVILSGVLLISTCPHLRLLRIIALFMNRNDLLLSCVSGVTMKSIPNLPHSGSKC
jgi:hypothetical protein